MSQSRTHSAIESVANVVVGLGVALVGQVIMFWWLGFDVEPWQNLAISAAFTGASLVRSYALRRLFYRWHRRV